MQRKRKTSAPAQQAAQTGEAVEAAAPATGSQAKDEAVHRKMLYLSEPERTNRPKSRTVPVPVPLTGNSDPPTTL